MHTHVHGWTLWLGYSWPVLGGTWQNTWASSLGIFEWFYGILILIVFQLFILVQMMLSFSQFGLNRTCHLVQVFFPLILSRPVQSNPCPFVLWWWVLENGKKSWTWLSQWMNEGKRHSLFKCYSTRLEIPLLWAVKTLKPTSDSFVRSFSPARKQSPVSSPVQLVLAD